MRLASLLLDDVGACEEVVQDAFVQVWQRGPALRTPDRLPAYLRSAVLNGARSQLRRGSCVGDTWPRCPTRPRRPRRTAAGGRPGSGRAAAPCEPSRERQREVLALRYYLDLSEAEIADTLGISAGSVKTHAHRGLATLAEQLEDTR